MECARKHGRYGHRDATMILVAYRHGLRASEVCDLQWQQIELSEGRLHVHRVKNGIPSVHPIRGDEMRALRSYGANTPRMPTSSFPSAVGQSAPSVSTGSSSASARLRICHSRSTHTCFAMPAGSSSPTMATIPVPCNTISATRTFSTPSGTPTWHPTASKTFGGDDLRTWAAWCHRFRIPAAPKSLPLPFPPRSPWHSRLPRAAPASL
jgi:Phage integrase family